MDEEARPKLTLERLDVDATQVAPGDELMLSLAFAVAEGEPLAEDLRVFVHLESPSHGCEAILHQADHSHDPPTSWWSAGARIELGARPIWLEDELPEGTWALHVGLFDEASEVRHVDAPRLPIEVRAGAPLIEARPLPSLAEAEVEARRGAQRARLGDCAELEGVGWTLRVSKERAAFELVDATGVAWTSSPRFDRLGIAHLSRGGRRLDLPLSGVPVVSRADGRLDIELSAALPDGSDVARVRLSARSVEEGRGLALSWRGAAPEGWLLDSVTVLDRALGTTEGDEGALILSTVLGELAPAKGAHPVRREYRSHDLSMKLAGSLKQGSGLLVTWDEHEAVLTSHADRLDHPRVAGHILRSVSMKLERPGSEVVLRPFGRGGYVELAHAYREVAQRKGYRVTLAQKRVREPRLASRVGAPVFRVAGLLLGEDGELTFPHTFAELEDCVRHWREDLGLDRAQVLIGGWNRAGYDRGYPDTLPANRECGGDEALARLIETIREVGFLSSLHDNYQDLYRDAPSWDEELVGRDEDGAPRAGGIWAGGQSWMVCGAEQLGLAQRTLPELRARFDPDLIFLDATLTTRLQSCSHEAHPVTTRGDQAARLGLFRYARELFGLVGLEGVREWGIPEAHELEGPMTHRTIHGEGFTAIPLLSMVYGDCVDLLTIQADRIGPASTRSVLDHLLYGELPVYEVGPGLYWEDEARLSEDQARDPGSTLARADQGWARGLSPTDRMIKNSWELVSYTHRAIGDSLMESHQFLGEHAEHSSFGELDVWVNYGDELLELEGARLGKYGFLVRSPGFVAFHALEREGVESSTSACFTLRSLDGLPLEESRRVRVFHAFGDPHVRLWGELREVRREEIFER